MSEIYSFQGKKYNVHETRLDDFLQKFPEAKKDNTGFIELDAPGGSKTKDMSNWQNMKNNLYNAFEMTQDVGEFYFSDEGAGSALDIATTLIWEGAFGKDKIKKWQESDFGKWFFTGYESSDSEGFQKFINRFEEEQKERKATKTFAEAETIGDYLNVAAGAMINVGGSVAYNLGTFGTGFFMEFASDNFITANEEKAKSKGVTLEQLVKNGEADTAAPLKIAAAQAGLEYIGFSKIIKPLKNTGISKTYNKAIGNYLTKSYKNNKNIRVGLDIISAGGAEAVTEMGQTGLEIYNKDLSVAKGKGEEINPYKSIFSGMLSPEGIEAGLQGFFGGGGLKGTAYSAKALNNIRKSNKDLDVEQDLSKLADLTKRRNSTKDEDLLKVFNSEINELQSSIKSKIKNGNDIYNNLSDGDIKQIEELSDLSDVTAFRANNLIEKFKQGEIFEDDFKAAIEGLSNKYRQNKQSIQELIYKENIEFAKTEAEKIGKEVVEVESLDEFQKQYEQVRTEGDFEGDVTNRDGFIKGDQIFINKQTALKEGAISVGSHELLHGVIGKSFDKLKTPDKIKLGKSFINFLNKDQEAAVRKRLKESYGLEGDAIFETEEIFTAFSDAIVKKEISFNENIFQKIGLAIQDLMNKLIPGYRKEFKNGRQAYDFLKEYQANVKEGKLGERVVAFAEQDKDIDIVTEEKASKTRKKLIDDINDLQQGATTKAEFQKPEIFNKVFESLQSGGAVNNYIRSLGMSTEKTQQTIDAVTDRLINFDPAAKRKDGTTIGPKGLGEFIMANVGFGKLVAAKKLAVEGEKTKKTTTVDTKEAKELEDTTPTETTQVDQKDVKLRKLNNFDIELQDGLVDAEIVAEVESLLEQNPTDLQARMEKLILSDIRKKLDNTVGKIAKDPKTGKRGPTPEYEAFIRNEYEEIVQSLGIKTIRTSYKKWFTQEKKGKKKYKNINPETGRVSNFVKDVQVNSTNKREYIRWFLESNERNLTERRTALLRRIARRKAEVAIDNYIEANSNNIDAVVDAKLRTLTRTAENMQDERVSFDSVKFSKSVKQMVNDYYDTGNFSTKGHALEQVMIDLLKSYNLPTEYLKVAVDYATEEGGIADINLEVLGEALRIEVKLNENVPMGSVLASNYNLKTRVLDLAKSSMDKSLPFDQIIELVHDDIVNLVEVYNGKVTAYNNKNGTNEPLMDTENPTGHRMVESIYNEMKAEGVTGKIFNKSSFDSPNAQPLIDHYLNKFAGAVKAIEIFGKGLYSFVPNSVLGPNVPYILNMARVETHVRVFRSGRIKSKGKLVTNKVGDGYVRFQLQFRNNLLKNSLKAPKKPVSLTRKEDMLLNLVAPTKENLQGSLVLDKSIRFSRSAKNPSRGITVLDFDDTLATTESLVKYTKPDGETGTLNAEQYASTYESLLDQGYTFDFSDFNRVVKGKLAPLFNKAMKLQSKFGPENMFVLTARPPRAQKAIFDFLKANGLNIPLKNITGLGNSTSEAKALWIADKVGEGYNDFYFADDALQNVQAVKNMLDQFDVKSKVQQARVKFSQTLDKGFNDILQDITGIKSEKRYSQAKARKRGESKGKFRFFIPPSHEDFAGLLYNFMGSGRLGNKHRDFFEKALLRPLNRAYSQLNEARQAIANDYKGLIRQFPEMRKKLTKKTPDGDYYYSDAVRVYLWNKAGFDIPGMSEADIKELTDLVTSDKELQAFAESIGIISKQEQGYVEPSEHWETGDIRTDLADATGRVGRKQFFGEFIENSDIIFSKENLNKIEAAYGRDFREALEDIIYRTKNGTNRTVGKNRTVNKFLDYLNGSIGATMFFNARSAVLQTISTVNFINFGDNNIFKAAKAFANQKQFWKDFSMIFNSDMLKQRRAGTAFDVNAAELSTAVAKSKEPVRAAIRHLLQIGFLPTQIADSFAISLGGSAMYRNRLNTYLKQGLSQKEAETKAFNDFQEVAESTQQSARPDKISQEQASPLGRMILAFQNTPSQYVRLIKKAGLDLINRRKTPPYKNQVNSDMSNVSKIIYYGAVQNVIFYGLQTALFAMMFDDDEQDEEFFSKKRDRIISGSIDTILRGMGVGGAIVSTIKNTAIKWAEQQGKGWGKEDNALMMEMLQLSPPIGIKARKLSSAEKTYDYNKKVIKEMETFDIDNPIWGAVGNAVEATTNIPLARLHRKVTNLRQAANSENEWWQRLAMALGWSQWDVGVKNEEVEKVKEDIKKKTKKNKNNRKKGFGMQKNEVLF
jgi:hypothetical protein